ncbi:MAG: 2,3-diphosphoglycerate-dependent phosphoglycerate mutase [Actinomycetota bacterium]|nr:2,3-diphosphoglycerate-dependent phosphoglycerate mutase [Actinomycetota bacterium]
MTRLVLLRHGQSDWNARNVFTGWYDSDLSPEGEAEAREAGRLLGDEGIRPDVVHTSVQTRAIRTANLALEIMDLSWLPVRRHWRLNERHYGGLQGLDKAATVEEHGEAQVQAWRRSYDVRPPPLGPDHEQNPRHDPRYRDLAPGLVPATECLKDVVVRMLPYWYDFIVPDLRAGRQVLISAHGNSLRALVKHLKGISDHDIPGLEIPTGVPWVFDLAEDLVPDHDRFLGDPDEVREKADAVKQQTTRRPDGMGPEERSRELSGSG